MILRRLLIIFFSLLSLFSILYISSKVLEDNGVADEQINTELQSYKNISNYFSLKEYEKVIIESDVFLKKYEKSDYEEKVLYSLAESNFYLKKSQKALEYYQIILDNFPESALKSHITDRIEDCKREDKSQRPDVLYQRARDLYVSKNLLEAIKEFKYFIRDHSENPLASNSQYWIGECYYDLGKLSIAKLEFEKVVEFYPSSAKVKDAKIKLEMIKVSKN